MRKDLDDQLVKEFPNLYIDRYRTVDKTPMGRGFSCGDGWFNLIYDLSQKLEAYIIDQELQGIVKASQVKQKFGGLRFYMAKQNATITNLISEAEKLSYQTCETCGKPGILRDNRSWWQTLCDEHAEARR